MLSINYSRYSFQPQDWIFTFTCCRNYNLNVPKWINPSYNKIITIYMYFLSFYIIQIELPNPWIRLGPKHMEEKSLLGAI